MDEQLMSWASARPEVTDLQHPSGLSIKLKYVLICNTFMLFLMLMISLDCSVS